MVGTDLALFSITQIRGVKVTCQTRKQHIFHTSLTTGIFIEKQLTSYFTIAKDAFVVKCILKALLFIFIPFQNCDSFYLNKQIATNLSTLNIQSLSTQ